MKIKKLQVLFYLLVFIIANESTFAYKKLPDGIIIE